MRVKRYVVESMPDALQRIRSDLGKEAVILNTKEVRSGGFFGFFGKKKIEVIAATDSSPNTVADKQPITAPMNNVQINRPPAPAPIPAAKTQTAVGLVEERSYAAIEPPALKPNPKEDLLLEEMKQMKELVHRLNSINNENRNVPPAFRIWETRLNDHDIDPLIVQTVIHNALSEAKERLEQLNEQQARQLIKNQLRRILITQPVKGLSSQTKVAQFVGPTGVGKTTTIAKLAAEQVLKHNRKVGFITSDTYRIAAVEQLKTYATILNVPLEVVFSPHELTRAFHRLEDRDIIFMDTAGRNYRNEIYVSELNSLLYSKGQSETYLVLSLTMKYKDMKGITENFAKFKLDKVLFTKMDETISYGSIINLVNDFALQLSYITNGQNVPDDITELKEEHLIDLIMEEERK